MGVGAGGQAVALEHDLRSGPWASWPVAVLCTMPSSDGTGHLGHRYSFSLADWWVGMLLRGSFLTPVFHNFIDLIKFALGLFRII